jgi:hypothetical protein
MRPTPVLPAVDSLLVRPWPDAVIDVLGHDARSVYVEQFWLGILGPSTTWLLRHMAAGLEESPAGFEMDLLAVAKQLGLGDKQGRNSPFMRSLARCIQFEMAELEDAHTMAVRRRIPPLSQRQVVRLPAALQRAHERWQSHNARTPGVEQMRRRSRQLALSLLELGEDPNSTELQLMRWEFHPAICYEAVQWARDEHALRHATAAPAEVPEPVPVPLEPLAPEPLDAA